MRLPRRIEKAYQDKEVTIEAIKKIKTKNLTNQQIADYCGVPKSTAQNWMFKYAIPTEKKHRDLLIKLSEKEI